VNYCQSQTVSSIFSVYLLGNTKIHRRKCAGHFLPHGELSVIVVLVHGRRCAGHFSPRGELSVIVVLVNGRGCAGHFLPRGELLVIVVLVNAEPNGPKPQSDAHSSSWMPHRRASAFGHSRTTPSCSFPRMQLAQGSGEWAAARWNGGIALAAQWRGGMALA